MPKGPQGQKRPADTNACAVTVGRIATGEIEDTGYVAPGRRKSGKAGGAARAKVLTKEERQTVAKAAAAARWGEGESEMNASNGSKLHSVLFEEGRELVNIKFFPGNARGLTPSRLKAAAAKVLTEVFATGPVHNPPVSGREKTRLRDF